MTIAQTGIVITVFLVVVTALLIWDEIRTEQMTRKWLEDDKHRQGKVQK